MAKPRFHTLEMPAYLDKEVSSADRDKFGHAHLARALRGLIEDERHNPPYSVGLLGKWGTGKSTVKSLYLEHLKNDETTRGDGVKRRDRVYTITFNAWKYGGETDIRKSLFRHIFLEIGGTQEEADQNLFKTVASTEFQRKPLSEIWAEFVDQYALGLLIVGLFAGLFAGLVFILVALLAWVFGFSDPVATSTSLAASAGVVAWLAQKFFSNLPILSARKPVHITSPPSQTIEEFEKLFLAQLRKFKKGRGGSGSGKSVRRVVVFIDDLDRLTADEMVSGLDGVRSLIEMASHEMADDTGIVFVISCDEERVADALSKRRNYAELPAAVSNVQDARRYLDRIFQFRLEIPPFPKRDMRNFVLSLLTTEYPALQADLQQRGIDTLELVDRMIHPGVQNPRNAIQIINLFAQSWWLGVLREHGAVGSENPGGLGEGVITGHPLTLAIVCVIRTDFPDFAQALQRKPRIFDHFIDRFIRPESLETLPDEIHEELTAFAAEVPPEGRWGVKPQHRGLRQFMSHIQDIRRPYSLQPFLALSQDPVSRRHGDKAVPIEEALRTADVAALLDAVGLTGSAAAFPPDLGALLGDLIDDLRSETPTIQDNVAFAIAQLKQRIPEKDRRRILGLVIRRAGDSEALRWRVGPSQLHDLTPYAESEELRVLTRSLIEDIAGDEETKVLLPSLEHPSLREGRELTDCAATLVLDVMERADLPPQAQQQLGQWLLHRTVKITGQSDQIPLSWLEQKLSEHEDILLPLIRDEYPRIIVEELSREQPEPLNLTIVTARVSAVFGHFFEQGTQTRAMLWGYLKDFAGLRQSPLVALAFARFAEWHGDAEAEAGREVFAALGLRLGQNEEDADTWPLDDEGELRDTFASLAETLQSFSTDGISHMVLLAQSWSMTSARSQSATRIYSVIAKVDPEQWAVLNDAWVERLFTDLPEACQRVILAAANREDAPNELRTNMASGIASLCGQIELNDHQIAAFSLLLRLLDESSLHDSPFLEHLTHFIDDTVNLIARSQNGYIISKVRALSDGLDKLPAEKAQQLLDSFAQLQPSILSGVFHEFSEQWPVPTSDGGIIFAAQNLFDAGISALDHLGQSDEAIQLLVSLDSLHSRTRLDQADNGDRLVAGAYALWSYDLETAKDITGRYPTAKRTPAQLLGLVGQAIEIIAGDGKAHGHLLRVLVREVGFANAEDSQEATANLLAQPPHGTDDYPDPTLALWVAAVSRHNPQILVDTLVSQTTNDEQAVRLYHHVSDNVEHLSDEHFMRVLRETLSIKDGREKTADAIVGSIEDVAKRLLKSDAQKRALCESVLSVFSEIPKLERKATLAKACTQFGLKNVIADGKYISEMPEGDLEIIEKYTGKI